MQISDEQVERFCSAFYAHWDLTANDVARGKVRDAILTAFAATPEPISVQNMRQEMSLLISLFKHAIATPGYGQDPASREEAEDHIDSAGRALEAALSLPVQPEDDLIAAREAAAATILAQGWSDDTAAQYRSGFYDHIESIQACLLTLRSRPASALPVVKPLEWVSEAPYSVARVPSLSLMYSTECIWVDGKFVHCELRGNHRPQEFATVAEAKAAAQADYERRILSALSPSVHP